MQNDTPQVQQWIIALQIKDKDKANIILKASGEYEIDIYHKSTVQRIITSTEADYQKVFDETLACELRKDKVGNMNALIRKLKNRNATAPCIPDFFSQAIEKIVRKGEEL